MLWELTTSYHLSYSRSYFEKTLKRAKCHIASQGRNTGAEPRRVDVGRAETEERFPGRGVWSKGMKIGMGGARQEQPRAPRGWEMAEHQAPRLGRVEWEDLQGHAKKFWLHPTMTRLWKIWELMGDLLGLVSADWRVPGKEKHKAKAQGGGWYKHLKEESQVLYKGPPWTPRHQHTLGYFLASCLGTHYFLCLEFQQNELSHSLIQLLFIKHVLYGKPIIPTLMKLMA